MSNHYIDSSTVREYRSHTFCTNTIDRVINPDDAVKFVNERGFIFFWPVKGITLPSLWTAHAGDIPVANEHDHPGHHTWGWKDNALGKRIWYYGKVLRRKATFISLSAAPSFYALSPNYGDPEQDFKIQYREGKLSLESKLLYETLLKEGPLNTVTLRKLSRLSQRSADYLFNKNIEILQTEMKVLPVGVAEAGSWNYSYIYDLTHRHFPDLPFQAGKITESSARRNLIMQYMRSVGCATREDVMRIFHWIPEIIERTITSLLMDNLLVNDVNLQNSSNILALPELVS